MTAKLSWGQWLDARSGWMEKPIDIGPPPADGKPPYRLPQTGIEQNANRIFWGLLAVAVVGNLLASLWMTAR